MWSSSNRHITFGEYSKPLCNLKSHDNNSLSCRGLCLRNSIFSLYVVLCSLPLTSYLFSWLRFQDSIQQLTCWFFRTTKQESYAKVISSRYFGLCICKRQSSIDASCRHHSVVSNWITIHHTRINLWLPRHGIATEEWEIHVIDSPCCFGLCICNEHLLSIRLAFVPGFLHVACSFVPNSPYNNQLVSQWLSSIDKSCFVPGLWHCTCFLVPNSRTL